MKLNNHQIQTTIDHLLFLKNAYIELDQSKNNHLEKIMNRLDCLEHPSLKQSALASVPLTQSWASVTAKKHQPKEPKTQKFVPPPNSIINEFKTASLIIHTPPGFSALETMSATDITTKINNILISINATVDSQLVDVAAVAILPSKDLKIYTSTRAKACQLLINKHHCETPKVTH